MNHTTRQGGKRAVQRKASIFSGIITRECAFRTTFAGLRSSATIKSIFSFNLVGQLLRRIAEVDCDIKWFGMLIVIVDDDHFESHV